MQKSLNGVQSQYETYNGPRDIQDALVKKSISNGDLVHRKQAQLPVAISAEAGSLISEVVLPVSC